jgi:TonB-linked SusC/RagA family outer membrane protein
MVNQEVKAIAGQTLKITLKDSAEALEEVVVIGYGSRARRDLTGSVGSISGAKLAAVPVSSAAVALQGKIAGVQVTTIDGAPGADINIRVRGGTSVTQSNEPLYIIDGFQADNINDIPPSDIQSIDVLKDASLTAIYGARGGNGVVVVTTKAAQQGKTQVSLNTHLQVSKLSKKLDLMNTYDFVRYQYDWAAPSSQRTKEYRANFGNPLDHDIYKRATTHDWQDEVMGETPLSYMTNMTIGGGSERFRFNTSLTQTDDRGIIMGSGVRRTNLNIKMNIELSKNLTLLINPRFTYRRDTGAGGDKIGGGGIIDVLRYRPTNGLREFAFWDPATVDPDDEALFEYTNPKNDIGQNTKLKHSYGYTNQFSLEWKPIKGLALRTEAIHFVEFRDENLFHGFMTADGQSNNKLPVAEIRDRRIEKYTWTNTATYGFDLNNLHNFSFLLGQEIQHSQSKEDYQKNRYFPRGITADKALANMGLGTPWESTSFTSTPDRTASFFGQANYNYDHKYLASVTFRTDGSTKFAPGEQWGYFPAFSGAWVLTKEGFLENNSIISNLKLRAAIGMAGNNRIDDDQWRYLYTINSTNGPSFGESTINGEKWYASASTFPNMKIKWETTLTRNIAFDLGLFGDRVTITPEVYWNTTKDLLYRSDIPSATGYSSQMQNIGQVTNRGFELTLNGDILRGKNYVLSANLTFGFNKTKVDKLNDTDDVIWEQNSRWKSSYDDYCLRVGDQIGLIYGFIYDGLYGFDEFDLTAGLDYEPKSGSIVNGVYTGTVVNTLYSDSNSGPATRPGKIKFKDLDNSGIIDENDRTVIGNTNPKFQGGFGLSGQYKNIDLTANFTYMYDFDVNNATAYQLSSAESNQGKHYNVLTKFNDRWTYVNDLGDCLLKNTQLDNSVEAYMERNVGKTLFNPADINKKVTHSYFIEDGSFIRCSDVTLGYTFPKRISQKVGLQKLRLYCSGYNLFILTGYSGYDPEVDIQTGLTPGMDYNRYPRSRNFLFGANITF